MAKKKVAKKKMVTKNMPMNPDDMFKLSTEDEEMIIGDLEKAFTLGPYSNFQVVKFNPQTVQMQVELQGGNKKTVYVGIEDTSSSKELQKILGTEPKIMAFFINAEGNPQSQTYFDIDDLEADLNTEVWADDIAASKQNDQSAAPPKELPFVDPSGKKQKTNNFDPKTLSDDSKERTDEWRKDRVSRGRGTDQLRKLQSFYMDLNKERFDEESRTFEGGIQGMHEKYGKFKSFGEDISKDPQWKKFVENQNERNSEWRKLKSTTRAHIKYFEDVNEHVDETSKLINEQLTYPFLFRDFVGDDYDTNSWKLSKLSNIVFGDDPNDDYRYKKQVTGGGELPREDTRDIKPDEQWNKDAETLKKIMVEQQEVLKEMGFVNDDGTVTVVRSIDVAANQVPEYNDENKGVIKADYNGSAADSWTLNFNIADAWVGGNDEKVMVKARIPLERVIASSWGLPPQHVMADNEHEVIVNSKDLADVELYPDYDSVRDNFYHGETEIPSASVLNKRTKKIMENKNKLDKKFNKKDNKVKININNKRNIDWLRSGNKNKTNKGR